MKKDSRIYVAGHTGLLGSALVKRLKEKGYTNIITITHKELDLTDRADVEYFFEQHSPEYVFLAAGMNGGIMANKNYPATFLQANIAIQNNLFEAANKYSVKHLIFYGSSCIYPKDSPQPIKEDYLFTGKIEETSEAYAVAKIAGITACKSYNKQYGTRRFISLIPNSIYGPKDNFDLESSHVLAALIRRIYEAKIKNYSEVTLWGTGEPRREFIFCEDVADASIFAMENAEMLENRHYNIGTGQDCSIKELASMISSIAGYKGAILWDSNMPDGIRRKLLDSRSFVGLGWKPSFPLEEGIEITYKWFVENKGALLCL